MAPSKDSLPVQYTLVIRLPFARGNFQDPPQVEWDTSKDKKLWKLIARNPKSAGVVSGSGGGAGEIDWPGIAADFGVDTPFLLQQAAWLYERHFKHVKAQMTRIRASSNTASPSPGAGPGHGPSMSAMGKRPAGLGSRAPSALSIRSKSGDSPVPRDPSAPNTPLIAHAPSLSRTPSTTTVTQSTRHFLPPSPRPRNIRPAISGVKPGESALRTSTVLSSEGRSSSSSSESSSSDDAQDSSRGNTFRRPHRFGPRRPSTIHSTNEDDEDDDNEPTFSTYLPQNASESKAHATSGQDPSATLRTDAKDSTRQTSGSSSHHRDQQQHSEAESSTRSPRERVLTVDSSTGSLGSGTSGAQNQSQGRQQARPHRRGLAALSPRQLARLNSPRRAGTGGTETSDGTPSMGSSFSDLDDASITQSALEEALASNFRHGGGSRLSNFSQAFRSSRS